MKSDFTSGKFKGLLLTSTFTLAINYLMLLSDNFIVGNVIGQDGIAAMSFISPLATIVSFIALTNSVGTTICRSRELGKFAKKRADEYFSQGLIVAILAGIILFVSLSIGRDWYFSFFGASAEITELAKSYYKYYVFVVLINPLNLFLCDIILAEGERILCNISQAFQVFGNIVFSLGLALHLGISGAALGSFLTLFINICILSTHFLRKKNQLRFFVHFSLKDYKEVVNFSVADAVSSLLWTVQFFLFNKFVIMMYGDTFLPVMTVIINVIQFTTIFYGVGMGMRSFVGIYVTEKNVKGMHILMNSATKMAAIEGLLVTAFFMIAAGVIPRAFGLDSPELIAVAAVGIRIIALTISCYAFGFMYSSYYLMIGEKGLSWGITLSKEFISPIVCGIGIGYLLKPFGMKGFFIGLTVGSLLGLVVFLTYVYIKRGRKRFPLLLEKQLEPGIYMRTIALTPDQIVETRNDIERFLKEKNVSDDRIGRILLIAEETGMEIYSQNSGRNVLAEYVINLNDGIRLIIRDDGTIMDVTDSDAEVTSFRSFVLSSIMSHHADRYNIVNSGYNRNAFDFK